MWTPEAQAVLGSRAGDDAFTAAAAAALEAARTVRGDVCGITRCLWDQWRDAALFLPPNPTMNNTTVSNAPLAHEM